MENVTHTKMSEGRRIAIPAALCNQHHLKPGDPVVLESSQTGILVRSLHQVLGEVQAYFADDGTGGEMVSEELIRERRQEAARENDA